MSPVPDMGATAALPIDDAADNGQAVHPHGGVAPESPPATPAARSILLTPVASPDIDDSLLAGPGEVPTADDPVAARLASAQELIRDRQHAAASDLLDPGMLPADADADVQIAWAEALADARQIDASDALFATLIARSPADRQPRVTYAKRLNGRGLLMRALAALEPIADDLPKGSAALSLLRRMRHLATLITAREGRAPGWDENARILAYRHAILAYAGRMPRTLAPGRLGRLSLMTGSLGPGGAERQLSRAAAELETARRRDGQVGGIAIDRSVEVVVRSHGPEKQNDFFLPDLRAADVDLFEINAMEAEPIAAFGIADRDLVSLLEYLPAKANFGLRRLVGHYRRTSPDVVSIWQDGGCLLAALAAVVAGVPRIQLVIRGLPPSLRRHLFLPEYEPMYRALAQVPGVEFISNSRAAARAYADWLDLPESRFSIVYNGVPRMPNAPCAQRDDQWQAFVDATPDAQHTIGGVFRFDTDKRPLTWIRYAANYARRHRDARFLLVGAGRLLEEAQKLAADLGVADRMLFVGRSSEVGYWMARMDVLVLMSRFEGLPNVLIEAQFLGVPVVSTPAGGADECFIEGVTGHILANADKTDLDEAVDKTRALFGRARDPAIFGPATRDFLDPSFGVSRMLENFVRASIAGYS